MPHFIRRTIIWRSFSLASSKDPPWLHTPRSQICRQKTHSSTNTVEVHHFNEPILLILTVSASITLQLGDSVFFRGRFFAAFRPKKAAFGMGAVMKLKAKPANMAAWPQSKMIHTSCAEKWLGPKMNIFSQCGKHHSKLSTAFRWRTWNGLIVATIPIDLAVDSSYWTGMTGMTSNWQNTRLSHAIYASFTPSANFRVRKSASICRISTWPREQVMCLLWGSNRMKDLEFSVPGTFWHLGHNLVLLQLQHGDCYWFLENLASSCWCFS